MRQYVSCLFAYVSVAALVLPVPMSMAQTAKPEPLIAWAPQPTSPAPFVQPNRLLWRMSDVIANRSGERSWTETVVLTRDFIGQYIQNPPGESTRTQFFADDRVFWVVLSGQIRFTIAGQKPFVASKGFLVQVPYRVPYSLETIGNAPSLRFEVRPAGEVPSYPGGAPPAAVAGYKFIQATYTGAGNYDTLNKPYVDFEKEYVAEGKHSGPFVKDDHTWANVIRSQGVPTPSTDNFGHFHENFAEFWIVLEGHEEFLIEGEHLVSAGVGDVVFAPEERWHRALAAGDGIGTRLAITPRPPSLHYYQLGHGGGD